MDAECAFCGRADAATQQLFCQDCQSAHRVCRECADAAASDAVSDLGRPLPARLVDRVADRVKRCIPLLRVPAGR